MSVADANDADVEGDLSRSSSRSSLVDLSTQDGLQVNVQDDASVTEEPVVAIRVDKKSSEIIDLTFSDEERDGPRREDDKLQP